MLHLDGIICLEKTAPPPKKNLWGKSLRSLWPVKANLVNSKCSTTVFLQGKQLIWTNRKDTIGERYSKASTCMNAVQVSTRPLTRPVQTTYHGSSALLFWERSQKSPNLSFKIWVSIKINMTNSKWNSAKGQPAAFLQVYHQTPRLKYFRTPATVQVGQGQTGRDALLTTVNSCCLYYVPYIQDVCVSEYS